MIHVATDDFLIAHNDSDMISSFIEDYQQFAPIHEPCYVQSHRQRAASEA